MEIRSFTLADQRAVVKLWNICCQFDPIDENRFYRQAVLDENFDPTLALCAFEKDRLIGFILGMHRQFPYLERGLQKEKGWICVLFVDASCRNQGIGTALCTHVENLLKEKGTKEIILGSYSPGYFFWGLDENNYPDAARFFAHRSYVFGNLHYSMGRDLHGYEMSDPLKERLVQALKNGYTFQNFKISDSLELLNFLKLEFGAGWKGNALAGMRNNTATDCQIVVRNPQGTICGWCARAIDGNPMRFGPIGMAEAERNSHLGSVLLAVQMEQMVQKGIYHMFFITTDEPGRRFYERSGLRIIRTSRDCIKVL